MPTELWLDFLAIRLDSTQAEGLETVMNLVTPDNGEAFVIEVSNATLTAIKGEQAADPNLNITVNRLELETVMGGEATLDDLVASGKATLDGDRTSFDKLRTLLVAFTPDSEIMPGTVGEAPAPALPADPFAQPEIGDTAGGRLTLPFLGRSPADLLIARATFRCRVFTTPALTNPEPPP